MTKNRYLTLILWLAIQTLLVWASMNFPFFWDAAYHAQVALEIYEHNFNTVFPDNSTDAGHPTLFNVYLAAGWKLFGKSLMTSHFLQLPFVWGYVYFTWKFMEKYLPQKSQYIAVALLCTEATLTAQVMSLNPDIALLCAFFMALYGIDTQKPVWIITGTALLSLLSVRGWIMGIALFCIDFVSNGFDIKEWKKYIRRYFVFVLLTGTWLFAHYFYTGRWFASELYKSEFSWGIIPANIIVFVFRLIDTGRIALWVAIAVSILMMRKEIYVLLSKKHFLIQSATITLAVFFILFVPLTNPIGHRYFMVVYVLLILWTVQAVSEGKIKKWILGLTGVFFIAGHFWVYPVPIANGWDSSLAHIPYFRLKDNLLQYAKGKDISFSEIYTFPPLHKSAYITKLQAEKTENLPLLNRENRNTAPYILYSNISNNFNKKELNMLQNDYIPLYTQKSGFVKCVLYQRK